MNLALKLKTMIYLVRYQFLKINAFIFKTVLQLLPSHCPPMVM